MRRTNNKKANRFRPAPVLVAIFAVMLAGCMTEPLYYWGNYEDQLYLYLKGESPGNQIEILQKDLGRIVSGGKNAPPGFFAHLGMLYSEMGNDTEAIANFRMEKSLFPEAAPLMDYLLQKYGI